MDSEEGGILRHLEALVTFLRRYERLWRAHVVEFFRERLWEILDRDWLEALCDASIEDLLLLPSHVFKESWPETLKLFLKDASMLSIPRAYDDSSEPRTGGSLPKIIADGMNAKKLHEIENLSSLIVKICQVINATVIVDVGAGQGYLAQVLAFHHSLPVIAVDCSAHNSNVTKKRAERIRKYYDSRGRQLAAGVAIFPPRTKTCRIGFDEEHMSLDSFISSFEEDEQLKQGDHSIVLAGLHACGDLSANMLRTFVTCQDVAAVVSVGCCYNLLSEENDEIKCPGFPLSRGVKRFNLHLGGAGRDLGCQSADRWKEVGHKMAAENFEVHAYRAALQIALYRFYPDVAVTSPSVGRLGKAKRRKNTRKASSFCQASVKDDQTRSLGFVHYAAAALQRLALPEISRDHLLEIWNEVHPFVKLIGPFWSLRSAIAPVLETLLLLDRLLFLKEQERETASSAFSSTLVPVFDPRISPRNMAIVATRNQV